MPLYLQPETIEQATDALASQPLAILAGGTDFYPARVGQPLDDDVLDISRISALRGIADEDDHFRIGALTSWTDLIDAGLPALFDGLKAAARDIGGRQIQNAGTIAGNICNASPAADGVPPLLSLDAQVELASARGLRSVRLSDFIIGNRQTRRAKDEIVTGFRIPKPARDARATFVKLGARKYLVISIVMVAVVIERGDGNTVGSARIAVGSCSAVAKRLHRLERSLTGEAMSAELGALATVEHLSLLSPIDDVRGSGDYRKDAALTLVRRALSDLGGAA
jgi:CO/xanthine dehydrogenase FAD-binding subunit